MAGILDFGERPGLSPDSVLRWKQDARAVLCWKQLVNLLAGHCNSTRVV